MGHKLVQTKELLTQLTHGHSLNEVEERFLARISNSSWLPLARNEQDLSFNKRFLTSSPLLLSTETASSKQIAINNSEHAKMEFNNRFLFSIYKIDNVVENVAPH